MIKNFDGTQIKPGSVNIRLDSLYKIGSKKKICPDNITVQECCISLPYSLKPGDYVLGKSMEQFTLPKNYCIYHTHRTSTMRIGILIVGGYGDPGYKGEIYFGIKNIGENTVVLKRAMSLSKVIFIAVEGNSLPLISRFQGGKLL